MTPIPFREQNITYNPPEGINRIPFYTLSLPDRCGIGT